MAVPISVADGSRMSPVPRSTEASVLTSQIETAPENSTCEYCRACSSTPPRPPSSMKNWPAEQQHDGGEEQSAEQADHDRVQRQRRRAVAVAGAERAADRRRNAAAHGARRHHLRQHHEGEHQRDRGQRFDAETADIGGFGDRHQGGAEHRDDIGKRQLQQRRQDRRRQQAVGGDAGRGARRAGPRWSCVTGHSSRQRTRMMTDIL